MAQTAMQKKMAMVRAGKKHSHTKKRASRTVGAIGKTTRRKSTGAKRVVVIQGARKRRKHTGIMGTTGRGGTIKQVAVMAAGIGVGAAFTHMALRPLEHRLAAKYPAATKFMGAGEVAVGGLMFMKMKSNFLKMVGLGVMAGGVHTIMKQTNIGLHSPAEGHSISGPGEMVRVQMPYTVGNIIDDRRPFVNTATVTGIGNVVRRNYNGPVSTPTVGDYEGSGYSVGDFNEDSAGEILMPKGLYA